MDPTIKNICSSNHEESTNSDEKMRTGSTAATECRYNYINFDVKAVEGHFVLEMTVLFCLTTCTSRADLRFCFFVCCSRHCFKRKRLIIATLF